MSFIKFKNGPIVLASEIVSIEPNAELGRLTIRMRSTSAIIVDVQCGDMDTVMGQVHRALDILEISL